MSYCLVLLSEFDARSKVVSIIGEKFGEPVCNEFGEQSFYIGSDYIYILNSAEEEVEIDFENLTLSGRSKSFRFITKLSISDKIFVPEILDILPPNEFRVLCGDKSLFLPKAKMRANMWFRADI